MKKIHAVIASLRIDGLTKYFFINCGVLFVILNLKALYWPSEKEILSGFYGQLFLALVLAISATYFSGNKSESSGSGEGSDAKT
ncbi:hypothetical protein [Teredinibacter purpureus]|uniref:hypothetical protein n=1 Tax=Teredinibacter purpureus TaxID=2731756 RepID=UPI0005F8296A|nr:hypothetical protein [Teredinibacter purpureus]